MKNLPIYLSALMLIVSLSVTASKDKVPKPIATSTVSGKVLDLNSGETLAGVAVSVEGTDCKVYTDLDGCFTIENLKPGVYNIVSSMISYKNSLVENIELLPDEKETLEIKLDNQ